LFTQRTARARLCLTWRALPFFSRKPRATHSFFPPPVLPASLRTLATKLYCPSPPLGAATRFGFSPLFPGHGRMRFGLTPFGRARIPAYLISTLRGVHVQQICFLSLASVDLFSAPGAPAHCTTVCTRRRVPHCHGLCSITASAEPLAGRPYWRSFSPTIQLVCCSSALLWPILRTRFWAGHGFPAPSTFFMGPRPPGRAFLCRWAPVAPGPPSAVFLAPVRRGHLPGRPPSATP